MLTAIVLAAGTSRRMGDKNKLLLPYKNKTVVAHVTANIHAAGITDIVVVLGFEPGQVRSALSELPVRFVENADYHTGMTGSIKQGLRAAAGDGYMICLADLVMIEPPEYAELCGRFRVVLNEDDRCICVPTYQNKRGNPVIFSSFYRRALLEHDDPEGCRAIVAANKAHVYEVPMQSPHVMQDMDTPSDYHGLLTGRHGAV